MGVGHRHWMTDKEKQDFVKCWDEDMPRERMMVRFHKASLAAVSSYATKLRIEGYKLKHRGRESMEIHTKTEYFENRKPTSKHPWRASI